MDLASAKRLTSRRARKRRVGHGSGSGNGKTCGRGHNGARSRSGWSSRNITGGQTALFRRLPKHGFSNADFEKEYSIINIEQLLDFESGSEITSDILHRRGIVKKIRKSGIKLLSKGLIDKALTVHVHAASRTAIEKIEASGGAVKIIPPRKKPVRNKMKRTVNEEQV